MKDNIELVLRAMEGKLRSLLFAGSDGDEW